MINQNVRGFLDLSITLSLQRNFPRLIQSSTLRATYRKNEKPRRPILVKIAERKKPMISIAKLEKK
jgi:hypothetical protein